MGIAILLHEIIMYMRMVRMLMSLKLKRNIMEKIKNIVNHDVFITVFCLTYIVSIVYLTCDHNNIAIAGFGLIIIPLIVVGLIDCLTEENN